MIKDQIAQIKSLTLTLNTSALRCTEPLKIEDRKDYVLLSGRSNLDRQRECVRCTEPLKESGCDDRTSEENGRTRAEQKMAAGPEAGLTRQ